MSIDTEKFGKFNTDLFKNDYQEMFKKIFAQYSIEFNLINDENWLAYLDIAGDISEDEKNEIIKAMESDPPQEKNKNKFMENRIQHKNKINS